MRSMAARTAGDRGDRAALPALVRQLEDEDSAARFFAILALERITGTRLGYDYAASAAERGRAVRRWQNYLRTASQPALSAGTQPAGGS
mgnify:CR=1 FL=1